MKIGDLMPDPCVFHTDLAIADAMRAFDRRVDIAFTFHETEVSHVTWQEAVGGYGGYESYYVSKGKMVQTSTLQTR